MIREVTKTSLIYALVGTTMYIYVLYTQMYAYIKQIQKLSFWLLKVPFGFSSFFILLFFYLAER